MKKQIPIFVALFATLFSSLTASAQGEWKWAHYWTGGDGVNQSEFFNNVNNIAFDDDGNVYVFGRMGGNLMIDGIFLPFTTDPHVLSRDVPSTFLAKYDTMGNLQWYKIVKCSLAHPYPLWMEVKNGNVYISGNCFLDFVDASVTNDVWLYYLDTLITGPQVQTIPVDQRRPPYKSGRYTYFAKFDTDGNLLEDHFVEAFMRFIDPNSGNQGQEPLCNVLDPTTAPFHVDNEGNTYVYTQLFYFGNEEDPYTIRIDGDTNKQYNIYLPGNADFVSQMDLRTSMMYKFSPNWELLWAKNMIDSTAGIATSMEITGDSIYPRFTPFITGLSVDENENIYISGYIRLALYWLEAGGDTHQYPVSIWFDSIHSITMNDMSSIYACNFILKYNCDGELVWSNQVYSRAQTPSDYVRVTLYGSVVHDNSVFVCGDAENRYNQNSIIYFENNENYFLDRASQNQNSRAFYVQFDKSTGQYLGHSIIPDEETSKFMERSHVIPVAQNNQLVIAARKGKTSQNKKIGLARWSTDGSFIDFTPANTYPTELLAIGPTSMDDNGNVLLGATMKGSINFGDGVVVNGSNDHSNALFALYHNPMYAQPYVGLPTYSKNESDLHFWPNPAQNLLNIGSELSVMSSVSVLDMNGKTILQKNAGDNQTSIDISMLPAGFYFLKVVCEKDVFVEKFIKSTY